MSSRHMIYPYTLAAKVAQFPYRFHWEQSWAFKYTIIGTIASIPFFWMITKAVNSPANVKKCEEIRHKEHVEHMLHQEHLL